MTADVNALGLTGLALELLAQQAKAGKERAKGELAAELEVTDRRAIKVNGVVVGHATYARGTASTKVAEVTDMEVLLTFAGVRFPPLMRDLDADGDNPHAVRVRTYLADWYLAEVKARALAGEAIPGVTVTETEPGTPQLRLVPVKTAEARTALVSAVLAETRGLLELPAAPAMVTYVEVTGEPDPPEHTDDGDPDEAFPADPWASAHPFDVWPFV